MEGKTESVEATTAHAQNLYCTTTFFAIFMVQILDFGMGYLKNRLIY